MFLILCTYKINRNLYLSDSWIYDFIFHSCTKNTTPNLLDLLCLHLLYRFLIDLNEMKYYFLWLSFYNQNKYYFYVQIVIHTLLISVCLHMPDNMTTLQMLTPTPNMNKVSITCVYMQVKMLTLLKISHHILCVIFSRNSMGVPLHTASFVLVDFNLGVSLIILGR